ncbi:glycoside hydrolase family 88 protein [Paenibacillus sp. PK4536]|uniref:glycoside hydrolase family 88/105 protein n=1 Tax=unclassified Paenibacillus TaxID=185978 RepID=UPI001F4FD671|nr:MULTISPECIES: glycoside hydrolase family 88 protein [unclassified Paenibacillus]WIM40209.1 glycoside hydrolase family 88 protein [Paenibacillus sp. PK4536]
MTSTVYDVDTIQNWAAQMSDSVIKRNPELKHKWEYDNGVIFKGMELVYALTQDRKYLDYIRTNMDFFIEESGGIRSYRVDEYNIDHVNNGKLLFPLYRETGEERYRQAADLLRQQLMKHPRTSEGAFWHKQIYPYQIWLDGLYMGAPFYAEYIREFADIKDYSDVTQQFKLCYQHTRDAQTGLLYHAWDEKKEQPWCDPTTGLSKNFWGRSMGWFVMALVDVLDILPEDQEDRATIIQMLSETMEALMKVQDQASGVFYQVLNLPDAKGNYLEASASCMILYAVAKGLRKGYLPERYQVKAEQIRKGIIEEFITITEEGLINLNKTCQVAGLGGKDKRDGTYAYYISEPIICNDPKGIGAFILAMAEAELLNKTAQ